LLDSYQIQFTMHRPMYIKKKKLITVKCAVIAQYMAAFLASINILKLEDDEHLSFRR